MAAASSSNDHVRLFAVSDVHVENEANARWIESLSEHPIRRTQSSSLATFATTSKH